MSHYTLTEDGVHLLRASSGRSSESGRMVVYITGDLGPATAKFVYLDAESNHQDIFGGELTDVGQFKITHGVGVNVYLKIAGASASTKLNITCGGFS